MSAQAEPSLINKNMIREEVKSSSLLADQLIQPIGADLVKPIAGNLNKPNSSGYSQIILFLINLVILFITSIFFFQSKVWEKEQHTILYATEREPLHLSQLTYQLESPSKFFIAEGEVDLSEIDAKALFAFNPETYQIYAEKNINQEVKIASITKLVTSLVMEETFDSTYVFEVKEPFVDEISNGIGLEIGDKLLYKDALKSLLIGSHNDVAMMIAQNDPGGYSAFINKMNKKAEVLGMVNTNFVNSTGYDDQMHYSTAQDLKNLAVYVLDNKQIMDTVIIPRDVITIRRNGELVEKRIETTNKILGSNPQIKGLKTGYTEDAGQCFIGYYDGGGDDKLITIILGSTEDRFEETAELLKTINEAY